ncbi:hypothetical protein [Jiangella asiatica]|uniref:Lipoprotein n=1 Tax=Jiangella asiatica TaxID=2530372 RepID=A0A4R5CKN0_9ACTN|nr:hypothetical protein [Jiangella asiatica]TDE00416.1 hypothetical protein E1269_25595 [Jiangella asiatica]
MNTSLSAGLRRGLLGGAAALVLTLAACGNDDDGGSADGGGDTAAGAEGSTTDGPVGTAEIDGFGTVLVDAEGNTLYTTEAEDDGTIRCVDGCAEFWPPLAPTDDELPTEVEGVDGEFAVIDRPDGSQQLTLDGSPLYTFAEDTGPGSFIGDGFEDDFQGTHFVWHAVTVEGGTSGGSSPDDSSDSDFDYDY